MRESRVEWGWANREVVTAGDEDENSLYSFGDENSFGDGYSLGAGVAIPVLAIA